MSQSIVSTSQSSRVVPRQQLTTNGQPAGPPVLLNTPLHRACAWGHKDVVLLLLEKGARVNSRDNYGNTPLHDACYSGHMDIVIILLEGGANINSKGKFGWTPLHWASYSGNKEMALLLIDRGARISTKTNCGYTPLDEARANGHKEIAMAIITKQLAIQKRKNLHLARHESNRIANGIGSGSSDDSEKSRPSTSSTAYDDETTAGLNVELQTTSASGSSIE